MLRRLNTRLDWGLGDSDIMGMFGMQIQTPEAEADAESAAKGATCGLMFIPCPRKSWANWSFNHENV